MNRMLMENGLSPSILGDPKDVICYALDEFVVKIREGQQRFEDLKAQ
jgi:hypothetical protein